MGLFGSSRMSDDQKAKAKGQAANATEIHKLALRANGYGDNGYGTRRTEREAAQRDLAKKLGSEKAAQRAMKDAAKSVRPGR
ncbi:hypothetical protein ACIBI0_38645 [Microbispora rosea]|uniref:hypothetical protein n=1 Tax=Microbispora rosea TaxID=58117 RepID=UPI00378DB108